MTSPSDFPLGVEIGTAFGAAHGQGGQCIFENLFKPQKFDDAQIHGRMKTDTAFEGADGVVELHAESAIDVNVSFVVHPGNPENDRSFRLDNPFVKVGFDELGMLFDGWFQRLHNFFNSLVKFRLIGISLLDFGDHILNN